MAVILIGHGMDWRASMPQLSSSTKRLRQSLVRRDRNRARKRAVKLTSRAAIQASVSGDAEALGPAVIAAQKALDKAAKTGAIHRNKAARRKSRIMRQIREAAEGN